MRHNTNAKMTPEFASSILALARQNGCDWLIIDDKGTIRDRTERHQRTGVHRAIRDLIESTSERDIEKIGPHDALNIIRYLCEYV